MMFQYFLIYTPTTMNMCVSFKILIDCKILENLKLKNEKNYVSNKLKIFQNMNQILCTYCGKFFYTFSVRKLEKCLSTWRVSLL